MSTLDECRRNFKTALRHFAAIQSPSLDQAEIQRRRDQLRQLLAELRRCVVGVLHTDHPEVGGTASGVESSVVRRRRKQAGKCIPAASMTQPGVSTQSFKKSRAACAIADPSSQPNVKLDAVILFAEECISAAQYLFSRGVYSDVLDVCFQLLEKDIHATLREIAGRAKKTTGKNAPSELVSRQWHERLQEEPKDVCVSFVAPSDTLEKERILCVYRLVAQYDVLVEMCNFYLSFQADLHLRERADTLKRAVGHLDATTSLLLAVAEMNADDSYFILFNGVVGVYEMCVYVMWQMGSGAGDVVHHVVHYLALCLELCESATLKLATVRYMPWRIRLYEYLSECYALQGLYAEALLVAQRGLRKVQDLVELEYLDPVVPPPTASQEIMLNALDYALLNVVRYTWYVNGISNPAAVAESGTSGGGGMPTATTALHGRTQSQQDPLLGDMPRNGLEMIERAWQLLLTVELPKHPTYSTVTSTASQLEAKAMHQHMDLERRKLVAERVRGKLVRFLVSFATASSSVLPPRCGSSTSRHVAPSKSLGVVEERLRVWAINALEFLAHYMVCDYARTNPAVKEQGLAKEFAEVEMLLQEQQQKQQDSLTQLQMSAQEKNPSHRRSNRARGNAAHPTPQPSMVAAADEALLSSLTLESMLQALPPLKPPMYVGWERNEDIILHHHRAGTVDEEAALVTLLLHRVLYYGKNAKLYQCLCASSVMCLLRWIDERTMKKSRKNVVLPKEQQKSEAVAEEWGCNSDTTGLLKSCKNDSHVGLVGIVCVSLHLLQCMRRVDEDSTTCMDDLSSIALQLKRLSDLHPGPTAGDIIGSTRREQKGPVSPKSSRVSLAHQSMPGTTMAISNCLTAILQGLLEDGANFLQQRVHAFAPGSLQPGRAAGSHLSWRSFANGQSGEQPDQNVVDEYYRVVCTYLEAKVKSGLTGVMEIGRLVLVYSGEAEADVSIHKKGTGADVKGGSGNATSMNVRTDGSRCGTTKRSHTLGDAIDKLRKKCERVRMVLSTIRIALGCLARHTAQMHGWKQGEKGSLDASTVANVRLMQEASPTQTEASNFIQDCEIRDMRTDLTRRLVELELYAAIHRKHYAAMKKHQEDIKILMERQENTKVYGVTTMKETNILNALLQTEPECPRCSDDEIQGLISWARDEGDNLLHALVLVSIAPYQSQSKAQSAMLDTAFNLLRDYENRLGGEKSTTTCTKPVEESMYSPFMIWCYAATVCGKLGLTNLVEVVKNVLYTAFANDGCGKVGMCEAGPPEGKNDVDAWPNNVGAAAVSSDPSQLFVVHPNEEMILKSSSLLLRTLVSAILWMSTVEMRQKPYKSFDMTGLMPFTGKGEMMELPFQQRYGLAYTQLWHMRIAYRIQFAMELADRVHDDELLLQGAFELFNAVLPTLVDKNYSPVVLRPLATLCHALLRQPTTVWADGHVQLLSARTLDALLKTVQRMSTIVEPVTLDTEAETAAIVPDVPLSLPVTIPVSVDGWYGLLFCFFKHAWNHVYNHPNPRQLRHQQSIKKGAKGVQCVLCSNHDGLGTAAILPLPSSSRATPSKVIREMKANKAVGGVSASVGIDGVREGETSKFPGSAYAETDAILDDSVPIEYLEILGDLLFALPGSIVASPSSQSQCMWRDKSIDLSSLFMRTASSLVGVPALLLDVARMLNSKSVHTAFERLQKAAVDDDPLYAKTAVYIVRYLLQHGDTTTAQRIASDAVQTIEKLHNRIQEYQQGVMTNLTNWLQREGYVFMTPSQFARIKAEDDADTKGKTRKTRSGAKSGAEAVMKEVGKREFSCENGTQWTPAEQQMLRQLTRGFAWIRRRRALRWLRNRVMQFTMPYQAQLQFYLSASSQVLLERRRQVQDKSEREEVVAVGPRAVQKLKTRGEDAVPVAALHEEELPKEKQDEEEAFVQHAASAALLFNRCSFPSRALAAISLAIDGLRTFVCEDPPDQTLPEELLLELCSGPGGAPVRRSSTSSLNQGNGTEKSVNENEKLSRWSHRVVPLAHALHGVLFLYMHGYVDSRHDMEFLQPAAVKVGRDVLLEEQLHFQGRVPSLHAYASEVGQYEEARLAYLSILDSKRAARSFLWKMRDLQDEEEQERECVLERWLKELSVLLASCAALIPPLMAHVVVVHQEIAAVTKHHNAMKRDGEEEEEEELVEEGRMSDVARRKQRVVETKKSPRRAKINEVTPCPIYVDGDETCLVLLAERFGSAQPAELIIDHLMFLLRYMQFGCQLVALDFVAKVHQLSGGLFAASLLPFALSLQQTIEVPMSEEFIAEYAQLRRNEPMHKVLVRRAQLTWGRYKTTEMYQRVVHRLSRKLLPSKRVAADARNPSTTTNSEDLLMSSGGNGLSHPSRRACGVQCVTLRDVIGCFEATIVHMRKFRLFGPLAEQLYELGRIHLLHRQRAEAERCWLEAVDAALEVPESLRQPVVAWADFPAVVIGLPRLILATLSLTSLAMYTYRERQGRAVDTYLLAARILERFIKGGISIGFPRHLRDFGGFVLEDLIVLPHLGVSLSTMMPQVVHHMLFLACELLKFKFPLYAAMVASLTEYLARTYTRHTALTVEARLVQAVAASYFGSYRASMKLLRDVCRGVRTPNGALHGTALCMHAAVECSEASRTGKSVKRGDMKSGSVHRVGDPQAETSQQQQQQQQQAQDALYDDSESPVSPGNIACVQTFLAQCHYTSVGEPGTAVSSAQPSLSSLNASASNTISTGINNSSGGLHEAVSALYGLNLSYRVELAMAESLIALGSKEAAYVWCANIVQNQGPGTNEKRGGRTKSLYRTPSHRFSNSACLEALGVAERILHSLLARLNVVGSTGVPEDAEGRKNGVRGKNIPPVSEDARGKRFRVVVETYVHYTSKLLLARIFTVRGECVKALVALQWIVTAFNERTSNNDGVNIGNVFACNVPGVPSFLWTLETHTFWCSVYELMVLNHMRMREYRAARQVIHDALALCDQCSDPYSGRVFSLYSALIAARTGATEEAGETLQALSRIAGSMRCDSRIDMLCAWTTVVTVSLERELWRSEKQPITSSSTDKLQTAVRALWEYCEMHGLPLGSVALLDGNVQPHLSRKREKRPFAAWSIEGIFFHHALNLLSREYMQEGKLEPAKKLLQYAISVLAPHYDTNAHPTPLIESHFILAHVLCRITPTLMSKQLHHQSTGALEEESVRLSEALSEENVLHALDSERQEPVQLLMYVVQKLVANGTHDYDMLRVSLLYLAVLLSRAGQRFHTMAATCVVLAKLVEDMKFHVFSGTSAFSLYGEDAIDMRSELLFPENIISTIQFTQRSLGHISEKNLRGGDPASVRATSMLPEPRRSPLRSREERDMTSSQKSTVSLPIIVAAFATLHRERRLQYVFPPPESLDHETALRHVRAYLQVKTAPLSCHYLWYSEAVREASIKQQEHGQGRSGESSRVQRGAATALPTDPAGTSVSLLPPIVMDGLPPLLSSGGLVQLGVPRTNAVFCQTFLRDAVSGCGNESSSCVSTTVKQKRGNVSGTKSSSPSSFSAFSEPLTLTFVLFVSPVHDPSVVQPPPLNEKGHQNLSKKSTRTSVKLPPVSDARNVTDVTSDSDSWAWTQCVVFDLPFDEVQILQTHALQALHLMKTPSALCTSGGGGGGGGGVVAVAADGQMGEDEEDDMSVGAALSRQLHEALNVLNTKTLLAPGSKKGARTTISVELSLNSTTVNSGNINISSGGGNGGNSGIQSATQNGGPATQTDGAAGVGGEPMISEGESCASVLDDVKSKLVIGFVELIVRAVVPRAVTDDELMERCVDTLLPRCTVSAEVLRFLKSMTAGDGGSISLFHPGLHEWFTRVVAFVAMHS